MASPAEATPTVAAEAVVDGSGEAPGTPIYEPRSPSYSPKSPDYVTSLPADPAPTPAPRRTIAGFVPAATTAGVLAGSDPVTAASPVAITPGVAASLAAAATAPLMSPTLGPRTYDKTRRETRFTVAGVHVSIVNGLRRTILGHLPSLGIVPSPDSETTVTITSNTTPLHNELIKDRLAAIVFNLDPDDPLAERLEFRLKQENAGSQIRLVTVADAELWDTDTNKALAPEAVRAILPPSPVTGDHSLLIVLHPPVGSMPGDVIDLRATMRKVTPTDNGSYAMASTCSYGSTPDKEAEEAAWSEADIRGDPTSRAIWKEANAGKFFVPNSYDFVLRGVGWMDDNALLRAGLAHMRTELTALAEKGERDGLNVTKVRDVIAPHSFDVEIAGDTFSLGHCLRHQLYESACQPGGLLALVGFDKHHAHDKYGSLRLIFRNDASAVNASHVVARAAREVAQIYDELLRQTELRRGSGNGSRNRSKEQGRKN
jgi:DNA-directed RNA polymerase subunit L